MPRILIVDSNLPFLMRLRKALEKQGLDVRAISRPRPALKELSQQRFDVAVVDLHMDWVNIQTFIQDLRARQPDLPIVLTGQYEEDPEKASELDSQGYLNKPYLARDLLPVVEKAIERGYTPSINMEEQIFAGEFGEVPSFDALLELALSQSQTSDEPAIQEDATLGQLLSTLYDEQVEADILQRVSEKRGEQVDPDVMPALVIPDDEIGTSFKTDEDLDAEASKIVQEQKWREELASETDNLPATSALKLANSAQAMHRFLQRVEEARKHTGRDVEVKPLPSWGRPLDEDEKEYQRALLEAVHLGEAPASLPETFESPPHSAQTQPVTVPEIDLYLDPNTPAEPIQAVDVSQIVDDMAVAQDMSHVPVPEPEIIEDEPPKPDLRSMLPRTDELPEKPHLLFAGHAEDEDSVTLAEPEIESQGTPASEPDQASIDEAEADEEILWAEPETDSQDTPALAAEEIEDEDAIWSEEPEIESQGTPAFELDQVAIDEAEADEEILWAEPETDSQDTPADTPESIVADEPAETELVPELDISEILAEEESLIPVSVDDITRSMGIDVDAEYEAVFGATEEVEVEEETEPEPLTHAELLPQVTAADKEAVSELLDELDELDFVGHATLQLMEMSLESTASAIMLYHDKHLIARSGELPEQTWRELEDVFYKSWERRGLGNTRLAYEDVYGIGDILLYSQLSLSNLILALVFPNNIPVSQIRKQATRLRSALEVLPEADIEPLPEPTQIIAVDDPEDDEREVDESIAAESAEPVAPTPVAEEEPPAAITQPSRPTGMRAPDGLRKPAPNPIPERDKGSYLSYGVLWLLDASDVKFNKPIANALSSWIYRLAADNDWDVYELEIGKGWINMHIEIPSQELIGEVLETVMNDTNRRLLNALGRDPEFADSLWTEGYSINTPGRLFTQGEIEFFTDYYDRETA